MCVCELFSIHFFNNSSALDSATVARATPRTLVSRAVLNLTGNFTENSFGEITWLALGDILTQLLPNCCFFNPLGPGRGPMLLGPAVSVNNCIADQSSASYQSNCSIASQLCSYCVNTGFTTLNCAGANQTSFSRNNDAYIEDFIFRVQRKAKPTMFCFGSTSQNFYKGSATATDNRMDELKD